MTKTVARAEEIFEQRANCGTSKPGPFKHRRDPAPTRASILLQAKSGAARKGGAPGKCVVRRVVARFLAKSSRGERTISDERPSRMNLTELIIEKEAFFALSEECEKIIDTRKRLPDFVFQRPFARYFAIEHVHIFKKEFGLFLFKLSNICGDESVNYMTLDPDPVDYYHRHHAFFGLASFKPSRLAERYLPVMSRDGNVDSFRSRGGDVGAFWGSSLNWGIFCDRISWEISVIAVPAEYRCSHS